MSQRPCAQLPQKGQQNESGPDMERNIHNYPTLGPKKANGTVMITNTQQAHTQYDPHKCHILTDETFSTNSHTGRTHT